MELVIFSKSESPDLSRVSRDSTHPLLQRGFGESFFYFLDFAWEDFVRKDVGLGLFVEVRV